MLKAESGDKMCDGMNIDAATCLPRIGRSFWGANIRDVFLLRFGMKGRSSVGSGDAVRRVVWDMHCIDVVNSP